MGRDVHGGEKAMRRTMAGVIHRQCFSVAVEFDAWHN